MESVPCDRKGEKSKSLILTGFLLLFIISIGACGRSERAAPVSSETIPVKGQEETQSGDRGIKDIEEETFLTEGVKKAKLLPHTEEGKDTLIVEVPRSPGRITLGFLWTINGKSAGEGKSLSCFRRGDRVSVRITPFDGKKAGQSRTLETEIKNTTPRIVSLTEAGAGESRLSFKAVAEDRDGDPITFSLLSPLPGMTIDPQSGVIEWSSEAAGKEDVTITVKVIDGQGGESVHPFKMDAGKGSK
jgi:hypothetical protein